MSVHGRRRAAAENRIPSMAERRTTDGRRLGAFALALLFAAAAFGAAKARPAPRPTLRDLRSLEEFSREFDAAAGAPRLVLLLSPT